MSTVARLIYAMLAVGLAMQTAGPVDAAEPLIVDLSSDEVAITTGFAGAKLLLFGAKDPGGDVVVVIRGLCPSWSWSACGNLFWFRGGEVHPTGHGCARFGGGCECHLPCG